VANADQTSLQFLMKTLYPDGVASIGYEDSAFLAILKKRTDFKGEDKVVPLRYANQSGRSASFTRAKALKRPSAGKRFRVTRSRDYCIGGIDAEAMKAATGPGAVADGFKGEIESMGYALTRSICMSLFRDGGGVIGQIASGFNTTTIELVNHDDIVFFEVGMTLDSSATPGVGGVATQGGASAVVTAIDRMAGTITAAVAWNNAAALGAGLANGHYLFQSGDYGSKLKGLDAWLPETAPAPGDSFFGVDRSTDVTRLGGLRISPKATIAETLRFAIAMVAREGGKPDLIVMNPLDFNDLATALGSQVTYVNLQPKDAPNVGFESIRFVGSTGPLKVVSDLNCKRGVAYVLQMNTWCLWSLDQLIHTVDDDGRESLRDSDSDSIEVRMRSWAQLVCNAPGYNARVELPAQAA
jgi:hypothetical protein